jgi:hypothetical protein
MAPPSKARGFAISSLRIGILLGLVTGYADLPLFHILWVLRHSGLAPYIEDPGPLTLFAVSFYLVLASIVGVFLGVAALIRGNGHKRLARIAIAVNLLPLLSLIAMT